MNAHSQYTSQRKVNFANTLDTMKLDTLSIYPNSFEVYCGTEKLKSEDYFLDHAAARFKLLKSCGDSLHFTFRVLPMDLSKTLARRNSSIIFDATKADDRDKFRIENSYSVEDVFGTKYKLSPVV